MTSLEEFNKKLADWDKTIELWDNIPNNVPTCDDEVVDWTEDDWTVSYSCTRPDLWNCMKTTGNPVFRPKITYYF